MQFLNCKIGYLKSQNSWVSKECLDIKAINSKMREILKQVNLQCLRKQLQTKIQQQIYHLQGLTAAEINNSERSKQLNEFCKSLQTNYQLKIEQITKLLVDRQNSLQKFEGTLRKENLNTFDEENREQLNSSTQDLIKEYSMFPYILSNYQRKKIELQKRAKQLKAQISKDTKTQKAQIDCKIEQVKCKIPSVHITNVLQKLTICFKKKSFTNKLLKQNLYKLTKKNLQLAKTCNQIETALQKTINNTVQDKITQLSINISLIPGKQYIIDDLNEGSFKNISVMREKRLLKNQNVQCNAIEENQWEDIPMLFQ